MKKQIYLLKHAYVPNWVYVGATTEKYLSQNFAPKWCHRGNSNTLLSKALRCSQRSDWSIEQLHDFTEDWQRLEAEYIAKYDSFHNGLNSTPSGAAETTPKQKQLASIKTKEFNVRAKSIAIRCSNGKTYSSMNEAQRQTGVGSGSISRCCKGKTNSAGGYTWQYVNNNIG